MAPKAMIPGILLAAMLPAMPALARDACLVGSWSPVGNGAAEWIQRQAPGLRMAVTQQAASLRLDADGSYSLQSEIHAEAGDPARSARSLGTFSARGTWASADGTLSLVPAASSTNGRVEMRSAAGTTGFALPDAPAQPTRQQYRCAGDGLETRLRVPGNSEPIVQRYRRQ